MEGTKDQNPLSAIPWLMYFTSDDNVIKSAESTEDKEEDEIKDEKANVNCCSQTFYSLINGEYHIRHMDGLKHGHCWASPQGWLLIHDPNSSNCFLFNPTTTHKVHLPSLEIEHPNQHCGQLMLSSSPTGNDCVVMFVDFCKRQLLFYDVGAGHSSSKWLSLGYDDQLEEDDMIASVVVSNKQFYGLTFQLNVVAIHYAPHPHITFIEIGSNGVHRAPGWSSSWRVLIASSEEVFFIERFVSCGSGRLTDLKIYKMDLAKRRWNIVDSIGDQVFLLGCRGVNFTGSFSGSKMGIEGDCIYYTENVGMDLRVFNFKEGLNSLIQPRVKSCFPPLWILPPI